MGASERLDAVYRSILKIKPAASSDTSVLIHQTTRRYIPKAEGPKELKTHTLWRCFMPVKYEPVIAVLTKRQVFLNMTSYLFVNNYNLTIY